MSLPLKRRIARAALLVAAAAPVIGLGAQGASAAGLPQVAELGGLSQADAVSALNVGNTAHKAAGVADTTGRSAARNLVPATGKTVDTAGRTLTPAAQRTVGDAAGGLGRATGRAVTPAHGGKGSVDPLHGVTTGKLPVQTQGNTLPVGTLPGL